MAAAISSVCAPRRARKFRPATPQTPRRLLLGDWAKLFRRARALRARLPELAGGKALDAAVADWLTEVKALARAHRWKKMLDTRKYATIKELAEIEKVHESYVGNLLRLTLLAPDITDMILDGRLPRGVGLAEFMKPWPGIWEEQRGYLRVLEQ